jgi:hypothetical protein
MIAAVCSDHPLFHLLPDLFREVAAAHFIFLARHGRTSVEVDLDTARDRAHPRLTPVPARARLAVLAANRPASVLAKASALSEDAPGKRQGDHRANA